MTVLPRTSQCWLLRLNSSLPDKDVGCNIRLSALPRSEGCMWGNRQIEKKTLVEVKKKLLGSPMYKLMKPPLRPVSRPLLDTL